VPLGRRWAGARGLSRWSSSAITAIAPNFAKIRDSIFINNTRIFIDKEQPPIACSISDISHSGARLTLKDEQELPETFTLLLTPNGGARRHCRVVWRDGLIVGVQFPESD
jgi:hypothetical protein